MSATILTPLNFLAVGIGAVLGAWSRWLLALWLNPQPNEFPIGTFAANMIGAYLIGFFGGLDRIPPGLASLCPSGLDHWISRGLDHVLQFFLRDNYIDRRGRYTNSTHLHSNNLAGITWADRAGDVELFWAEATASLRQRLG